MASKQAAKTAMVRLLIPAGKASPSPPVGPALGAKGVKSMDFCKEFNAQTAHIEPGLPIPTRIFIAPDRSFTFVAKTPPVSYFLKKTTGIEKGTGQPDKAPIATVSVKHIYEIAKIKHLDSAGSNVSLESVARSVVSSAKSLGIKVVL